MSVPPGQSISTQRRNGASRKREPPPPRYGLPQPLPPEKRETPSPGERKRSGAIEARLAHLHSVEHRITGDIFLASSLTHRKYRQLARKGCQSIQVFSERLFSGERGDSRVARYSLLKSTTIGVQGIPHSRSRQFQVQPSCIALKKTSERRTSILRLKISVPSRVLPQTSRSKGLAIRNGLSRRRDGEWRFG
jgi:hypothetical protein